MLRLRRTLVAATVALVSALTWSGRAEAAISAADANGYWVVDEADGAVYNWIEISVTGALIVPFSDSGFMPLTLGAPFELYGANFTDVKVSPNGYITVPAAVIDNGHNECPLPPAIPHLLLSVLHDDLQAEVFYQYFDAAGAAALGFAGETVGVSVFQWRGDHLTPLGPPPPGQTVQFEAVLFHGSGEILIMVAVDDLPNLGTMGISDAPNLVWLDAGCSGNPPVPRAMRFFPPGVCGNGEIAVNEECDDGGETATCDIDCTYPLCGDGLINVTAGEACDEGVGAIDTVTCDSDCSPVLCGDGHVNPAAGEGCDVGGVQTMACDIDCTLAMCGDGYVNPLAGELCDDGGESASCDLDCTPALCGDGVLNPSAGETCDDGGPSLICTANCLSPECGDGVLDVGDECDDAGESATCDANCTFAMCGDSTTNVTAGEACDDGGESASCDDDCTLAACGDGHLNATAGEVCDDGNTEDGDTCAADCSMETDPEGSTGDPGSSTGDTGEGTTGGGSTGDPEEGSTGGSTGGSGESAGDTDHGGVDLDGTTSATDDNGTGGTSAVMGGTSSCACTTAPGSGPNAAWWLLSLVPVLRRRRAA